MFHQQENQASRIVTHHPLPSTRYPPPVTRHPLTSTRHPWKKPAEYSCRTEDECPLQGKYLETNVVQQAIVTTDTETESYVGLATNFKERFRNHTISIRHVNKRNSTELSKHERKLKDAKKPFNKAWKVLRKCKPYKNITKKCSLCLYEKNS